MKVFSGFLVLAALLLGCHSASAEKRVALVVGNSNYQNAAVLPNPANDATAVAATLKDAGFDLVTSKFNLQAADMRRALRDFADQAREADIAVVYYAGHGIEIDGTNYLIPTDAKLERDTDIYDEAFSLDRVLLAIEPARSLRLVIVDACRNNPFADTMKRTVLSRSISRGLARVEPATTNTLVAFAAKAGLTALDGNSKNSPYATALVKYIARPGLDLRRAFGFIRDDVLEATGNRQEPYVYGSLGGADVALVPAKPAASTPANPSTQANPQSEARQDYEAALQLNNKDALNAFLAQHPDGYYASLAKLRLATLTAQETQGATKKGLPDQEQPPLTPLPAQGTDQNKAAGALNGVEATATAAQGAAPKQEQAAQGAGGLKAIETPTSEKPPATQVAAVDPGANETITGPSTQDAKATSDAAATAGSSQIARSIQIELRRIGCLADATDGDWNAASQRSMAQFNRYAGTHFDTKVASADALDAIKLKPSRVCPLVCQHGFKPDGDHCSKIVCAEGSFLNDDNECEKRRGKARTAKRDSYDRSERSIRAPEKPPVVSSRVQASRSTGQIICDSQLCRPVRSGCHLESNSPYALKGSGGTAEICH
ncbi:caspase family protein [Bradyrhizobium sp.]|uniref:caspase family protein n=1 Tax=Bradyrhizobium sp. TaxID=376 RepID=UPI001EC6FE82|nr:caspase family protein [Bradyrhizobium sp.]MBV9985122.1 caspase family protein [Bradyrhizobium sp.]